MTRDRPPQRLPQRLVPTRPPLEADAKTSKAFSLLVEYEKPRRLAVMLTEANDVVYMNCLEYVTSQPMRFGVVASRLPAACNWGSGAAEAAAVRAGLGISINHPWCLRVSINV